MEAALREIGHERYHNLHPFHRLLHTGRLSKGQVQAWALNRYLYQSRIPRKDAALLARCEDADLRRAWLVRILDHDGNMGAEGGIVRWLHLCEGLGLDPGYVESEAGALPATPALPEKTRCKAANSYPCCPCLTRVLSRSGLMRRWPLPKSTGGPIRRAGRLKAGKSNCRKAPCIVSPTSACAVLMALSR